MITQELLKELFEYNPDTGDFIRKVSKGRAKAGTIAGSPDKDGYIFIGINRKRYAAHRLAFLYMEGYIPDLVHHLNNIRKDNRWCNLKDATSQENNRNKVAQSNSGYLGVSWKKDRQQWRVQARNSESTPVHGGYFRYQDLNLAVEAANTLREELHGELAVKEVFRGLLPALEELNK
ncbi:putative homing endonuclease [Salmonella phage falkor]|uniref:HNH homing endonuclease n=7 Tax=Caudoviricetes TaxID=2731619 RepID=A0A3G8F1L4_9CAUD|nr:putative homing endonuclease [Salmonella phage S132]YP_009816686.1 HNH homing endonuclease [Salmonella phage Seafire]YP_009858037.1 putative homing endonuclease [Salmonella phage bombadil]YP_009858862.1 putative homing endonuclease [Salmonella phage oselot]QDB70703.1 hypothetical protein SB6_033 [Salmonella phage vB_SenS_SB6]QIO01967.1 putative homing endonuclease [Salmonella phage falkor]AXC41892.1 putative homing endonuclease [Salmonella phage S132]AZF87926.1 HNH homing endonuclease [Sa